MFIILWQSAIVLVYEAHHSLLILSCHRNEMLLFLKSQFESPVREGAGMLAGEQRR